MKPLNLPRRAYFFLFLMITALAPAISFAQTGEGEIDLSFNSQDQGYNNIIEGADNDVRTIAIQPDGKILIGGLFLSYSGQTANYITRINADGSKDASFNAGGTGTNGNVTKILLQADGKILVAGTFTTYNGITANALIRLNADGSRDAAFDAGAGPIGAINAIAVQTDGKILAGGTFTNFNGADISYLTRLNANGTQDISFNSGSDITNPVNDIAVQADGKVLVGTNNNIKRISAAGITDATFNAAGAGTNGLVKAIALQPDGKILIGGDFNTYNGTATSLTRLNTNGSIDVAFTNNTNYYKTKVITLQSDGKILIGWGDQADYFWGAEGRKVNRLNADGTNDTGFTYSFNDYVNENVYAIQAQADGKVLVGETIITRMAPRSDPFTGMIGSSQRNFKLNRYNSTGVVDELFGLNTSAKSFNRQVKSIAVQADGKVLVAGYFFSYDGSPAYYLIRLNTDGSRDLAFNPNKAGPNSVVTGVAVQPDGKILIIGTFNTYNGTGVNYFSRLNTDGSLDVTFNVTTVYNPYYVSNTLIVQPDGKILVGYWGGTNASLVRFNTDGSIDTGFTTGFSMNGGFNLPSVQALGLQSDGKIIAGGRWDRHGGNWFMNLTRLNTNGSKDVTFTAIVPAIASVGPDDDVNAVTVQPDGKILVAGLFTVYSTQNNPTHANYVIRLNSDGNPDPTFNPNGAGANAPIISMTRQADGKILIAGTFTSYNGYAVNGLARLNADGSFDNSFNLNGVGIPGGGINTIAFSPDGKKILIAGNFTSYNTTGRNRIARIRNCSASKSITNVTVCTSQLPYSWNGNNYNAAGTYSKTFNNPTGCDSVATLVLTVSASAISGPNRVCAYVGASPNNAVYTVTAPAGSTFTWSVSQPATMTIVNGQGTNTAQIHFTDPFVSGNVYVSVKNIACNFTVKPYLAVSKALPSTPGAITAPSGTVCPYIGTGNSIRYSIRKVTGATSYNWVAQAGTTIITHTNSVGINDTTVTVTFATGFTTSAITVQAVNDCGVSGIRSLNITRNNPSAPGAMTGPVYVCDYVDGPNTFEKATYTIPYVAGVTYNWTIPAGSINVSGGNGSNSISFNFPVGYSIGTISVTATNGCGTSSVRSMTVKASVAQTPGGITAAETASCPSRIYSYSIASIPANADQVIWSVPAGASIVSGQYTTSISVSYPSTAINGYVSLVARNSCGTSGTRKIAVSLPACTSPFARGTESTPASVIPKIVEGLSEEMEIKVYPNPSLSEFNLVVISSGKEEINVRVMDIAGRFISENKMEANKTLKLGASLKTGTYLVEVRQGNTVKTTRLIKL